LRFAASYTHKYNIANSKLIYKLLDNLTIT
jgi:hypothetical protein